jgi:hypothetical protein
MDIGLSVLILTAKVGENFRRQLKDLVLLKLVGSRGERGGKKSMAKTIRNTRENSLQTMIVS